MYYLKVFSIGSLVILISYVLLRLIKFYKNRYILSVIPCPPGYIFLGNVLDFVIDPEKIFDNSRRYAKNYWPIYRLYSFFITVIGFMQPEDLEIILSSSKHLSKSGNYEFLKCWLGEGLLTSTGNKWRMRRKILTPAFHFNMLQKYIQVFYEETEKLVEQFEKESNKPFINVVPLISQMTLQTINETAMGIDNINWSQQIKYKEAIYRIGKIILLRLSKPWYRLSFIFNFTKLGNEQKSVIKTLHDFAYQVISDREKKIASTQSTELSYSHRKRMAFLDILLSAKNDGENIELEGIREEVDTFMFEGHDTTAAGISFLLLSLACNTDIQENVVQEIEAVLGTNFETKIPTYNDLQQLKYTERVIKEALRLYPSVPFISRIAGEDFVTHDGYTIPKGTILDIHIFDMHRHPSIYPDPLKFDPDRFLPENCEKRHNFAYLPFSAGPRNCIGQKFALLELKSVLCGVLRKFHLEAVDKPEDVQFSPDLVLRARDPIRIKFVRKKNNKRSL